MSFPTGFLWGAATSAHQTEGDNTNSDWWYFEQLGTGLVQEKSGRACDSYHRYGEDMRLLAAAGLNAYRFSIEWARIEPAEGEFDPAQLDHYQRMIATAQELGLTPVITLHHNTNPLWFLKAGGWRQPDAPALFARYVERTLPLLDGVEWVCTINEPNMAAIMARIVYAPGEPFDLAPGRMPEPDQATAEALMAAHRQAVALVRSAGCLAGWSVATMDVQAQPGYETVAEEYDRRRVVDFLDCAKEDDFIGVQAYTRAVVGEPAPVLGPKTDSGWEIYPEALAHGVAQAWVRTGRPVLVSENGIPTSDDDIRISFTAAALAGLEDQIAQGVDVRGYLHWSLLDNFEWGSWEHQFGLVAVDKATFARHPKPSLAWLGQTAQANGLTAAAPPAPVQSLPNEGETPS